MALTKEEIKAQYPLPVYNYKVSIDGELISFRKVDGLNISFEVITHKESPVDGDTAGPVVMRMPAQPKEVTITLEKGLVAGKSIKILYDWINQTLLNQTVKKDIEVQLCDESGAGKVKWTVMNAFPTTLTTPTFDATVDEIAIESMELMADRVMIAEV